MPLKGIKCACAGGDEVEQSFDHCLQCARTGQPHTCHHPLAMIKFMEQKERSREGIGQSATGIIACARQNILLSVEDYYESPDMMYPLFQGDVWHMGMEHWLKDEPDLIIETRYERSIDVEVEGEVFTVWLSGKPDEEALSRGLVNDHKRIGRSLICEDERDRKCLRKPYPENEQQVNIYAWILRDGRNVVTGEPVQREITQGGITYADGKTSRKMAVPIWSAEEQDAFVRAHVLPRVIWEKTGRFPPVLPATLGKAPMSGRVVVNRHWKCDRCPVRAACDLQAEKETGVSPNEPTYWQAMKGQK